MVSSLLSHFVISSTLYRCYMDIFIDYFCWLQMQYLHIGLDLLCSSKIFSYLWGPLSTNLGELKINFEKIGFPWFMPQFVRHWARAVCSIVWKLSLIRFLFRSLYFLLLIWICSSTTVSCSVMESLQKINLNLSWEFLFFKNHSLHVMSFLLHRHLFCDILVLIVYLLPMFLWVL